MDGLAYMMYLSCKDTSPKLFWWNADAAFKFSYAALHLKQARIGSISIVMQHFNLTVQLLEVLLLVTLLSLHFPC